jgi:hypothetical protein
MAFSSPQLCVAAGPAKLLMLMAFTAVEDNALAWISVLQQAAVMIFAAIVLDLRTNRCFARVNITSSR